MAVLTFGCVDTNQDGIGGPQLQACSNIPAQAQAVSQAAVLPTEQTVLRKKLSCTDDLLLRYSGAQALGERTVLTPTNLLNFRVGWLVAQSRRTSTSLSAALTTTLMLHAGLYYSFTQHLVDHSQYLVTSSINVVVNAALRLVDARLDCPLTQSLCTRAAQEQVILAQVQITQLWLGSFDPFINAISMGDGTTCGGWRCTHEGCLKLTQLQYLQKQTTLTRLKSGGG
eukprot:6970817-Pyramimonas_sp.AAC.3